MKTSHLFTSFLFAEILLAYRCHCTPETTLTKAVHYTTYTASGDIITKRDIPNNNNNTSSSVSFDNVTCMEDSSLCSGHMGVCCTYEGIQSHVSTEEYSWFEDAWTCVRNNYTCCPASDGRLKGCPPGHSTCCIWGYSLNTLSFGCCNGKCSSKPGWCDEGAATSQALTAIVNAFLVAAAVLLL